MSTAQEKVEAATELLRGGFRLNLSFLRDRFVGSEAAQNALTEYSTRVHAATIGLEAALFKALAEAAIFEALHVQFIGRALREPPAGAVVRDFTDKVERHPPAATPALPLLRDIVEAAAKIAEAGADEDVAWSPTFAAGWIRGREDAGRAIREKLPKALLNAEPQPPRSSVSMEGLTVKIVDSTDPNIMGVTIGNRHVAHFVAGARGPFWYLYRIGALAPVMVDGKEVVAERVTDMRAAVKRAIDAGVEF